MLNACASRATFLPMLPSPTMPSVLPWSSNTRESKWLPTRHLPATTSLWNTTSRFKTASISMIACSETAIALAPPLFATGTFAFRADSMSTRS